MPDVSRCPSRPAFLASTCCEIAPTTAERVAEYADIQREAATIVDDYRPESGWPGTGVMTKALLKC